MNNAGFGHLHTNIANEGTLQERRPFPDDVTARTPISSRTSGEAKEPYGGTPCDSSHHRAGVNGGVKPQPLFPTFSKLQKGLSVISAVLHD